MARILLIDDDESVRTMLRLTLIKFGHTVVEASHGKEGLRLFPESRADLVITDIVMPEMEGLEIVREIRKLEPSAKIIAISGGGRGNSAADYLHMAKLFGAARILAKPFSNEALLEAINELLPAG